MGAAFLCSLLHFLDLHRTARLASDGGAPAPGLAKSSVTDVEYAALQGPTTIRGGSTCSRPAQVTALPSGSRSRTSPACSGRSPRPPPRPAAVSGPAPPARSG